jgi:hypothetical protein
MYMFDGAQCGPEFAGIGWVFARGANCRLVRGCHANVSGSSFTYPNEKSKKFMSKRKKEEGEEKPKCEEYFGGAHSHSNVGPLKLQSMDEMELGLANGLQMLKQFIQQTQLLHQLSNVDCEELEGTLQISTDMNQRRTNVYKEPKLPTALEDGMSVDDETPVAFVERLKGENVYKFTTKDYDFTLSAEMEKAIKDVLDAFEATASVADAPSTMDDMVQALAEDEAVRQELAKVAPGSRTWPSWTLRAAVTSLAAEEDILPRVNELQEVATKLCRRDYAELQALVADARKHLAEMSSLKERIKSSGRAKPSVAEKAYATNQRDTFCEKHGLDSEQYKELGTLVRAN